MLFTVILWLQYVDVGSVLYTLDLSLFVFIAFLFLFSIQCTWDIDMYISVLDNCRRITNICRWQLHLLGMRWLNMCETETCNIPWSILSCHAGRTLCNELICCLWKQWQLSYYSRNLCQRTISFWIRPFRATLDLYTVHKLWHRLTI